MRAVVARVLDRLAPRRRARAAHRAAVAAHLARFCHAEHPEHPGVTCSWLLDTDGTHPYDHDGCGYTWPQGTGVPATNPWLALSERPAAQRYTTVSPECSVGDCGPRRCSTPDDCGCGHHTPAAPTPPHLRDHREPKEDTGV